MEKFKVLGLLQATADDADFLRYNIPEELAKFIRPLTGKEMHELSALRYLYRTGNWTDKASKELMKLRTKADTKARALEQLLKENGYVVRYSNAKQMMVVSERSAKRTVFTWQLPEYEEYDAGLLKELNEDDFLRAVMSGMYDDKHDKEYMSQLYPKTDSLYEGVDVDGDSEPRRFLLVKSNQYEPSEDDNTELTDLHIVSKDEI